MIVVSLLGRSDTVKLAVSYPVIVYPFLSASTGVCAPPHRGDDITESVSSVEGALVPDPAIPTVDQVALASLDELAAALDDNARDQRLLAGRIRYLRDGAARGKRWKDLLDGEPRPGALQLSSTILTRLTEGTASLRRSLVRALRAEGATIPVARQSEGTTRPPVARDQARPSTSAKR